MTLKDLEPPKKRPLIATIVAEGGRGKTTLGSLFPNPVFIRTEDGTQSIAHRPDVALFPVAKNFEEVFDCVQSLLNDSHKFKTLVVDSLTQFSLLIESAILAGDTKAKSMATVDGGYGAGYARLANVHRNFRDLVGRLVDEKSMNVIFLAHAETETIELPDQPAYTRYTMRMHKKSVQHYSDNVDLVGFIKERQFTTDGKTSTTGELILTCYPTPSHISKNRFGIDSDIVFQKDKNPLGGVL